MAMLRRFGSPLALLLVAMASPACADDGEPRGSFASVFTDNAVLQRNEAVAIWGTGSSGDPVRVELGDQSASTTIGSDGKWNVSLSLGEAHAGDDLRLLVRDRLAAVKRNVAIGDVYLCSGQSNMQWTVGKSLQPWINVPKADDPGLRLLLVHVRHSAQPLEALDPAEQWQSTTPESVNDFSGVCYYFGQQLRAANPNLPVGLISSARGGSKARAWISNEALASLDGYERAIALNKLYAKDPAAAEADYNADPKLPRKMDKPWLTSHGPSVHFNAMIAPLIPYTLRGAAWYQGESDTGDPQHYSSLLPTLIADWRKQFRNPELPWFIIQLASFGDPASEPSINGNVRIRQVQQKAVWDDPRAALIVTSDIGNPTDIHPTNKQEVGRRMLLAAERLIYHTRAPGCDTRAITLAREGTDLMVVLPDACAIAEVYEAPGVLGFEACDEAGLCRFTRADLIDPQHIRVNLSKRAGVTEVRFCSTPSPFCNVRLAEGEPLPPFTARVE